MPAAPKPSTGQPLANAKHERFAQLVVSGLPQSRAFVEAGFKGATDNAINANASRLITNDKVASRIAELRAPALVATQKQAEAAVASAEWIIEQSLTLIRRCMAAEPVLNARGEATGEYRFDSAGANKSLDRLAKMHPTVFSPDAGSGEQGARHLHLHGLNESELRAIASGFGS